MRNEITSVLMFAFLAGGCGGGEAAKTQSETAPVEQPASQGSTEETDAEQAEADQPETVEEAIRQAAKGDHRSEKNIARNQYRHPVETLLFFGIEPDMTVVELWPGGGWYTEVLAPVLTDGQLIAASYAPKPDEPDHYRNRVYKKYDERLKSEDVFSNVRHGMLEPPDQIDLGEPGSADLVVTFRNTHNWIGDGLEEQVLAAAYEVLRPGGTLGVVQHRANEGADPKESAENGYVPESYVIEVAENAGFEFVEKSEVNANPKDTKDHPEGVWTLPPSYRLEDVDREKYEAIGESDRMTLKFRKPQ